MTTINYRLQKLAGELFIKYKSSERAYIEERIAIFSKAIRVYFGSKIEDILVFGSYKRDTILPRHFDEHSDIDVLVIFNQAQNEFTPETYRNQLRKFAQTKYPTTKVLKDHPSVVLEMRGIKFDLVPCRIYSGFFDNYYQIPDKNGSWMDTDPLGFSNKLANSNNNYNSIVKPIIRLLKCWNAYNSYPYQTFELEKIVADFDFTDDNYQTGFLYAIRKLSGNNLSYFSACKVDVLKSNANWIKEYLERDNQVKAIEVVHRILGIELTHSSSSVTRMRR